MRVEFRCDLEKIKEIAKMRKINLENFNENEIIRNAEKNKKKIESEWRKKETELISVLKKMLPNLDDDYNIKIYIFPINIPVGACNCETKEILYGYPEEYKGFNLVTICHEITHILIYKYRKEKIMSRITDETIAFLVAECEVRRKLTKKEYFIDFFSGKLSNLHQEAVIMARKNLDNWKNYLLKEDKNIEELIYSIEKNVPKLKKEMYKGTRLKEYLG